MPGVQKKIAPAPRILYTEAVKKPLTALVLALALSACQSVRTVYDEFGNEVHESEPGKETDIMSRFEDRMDSSFSLKKNDEGVPEAVSNRVSRYQKDLENARGKDMRFGTSRYGSVGESNFAGRGFDGRKSFEGGKSYEGGKASSYSKDLRPDFMNDSRGLAHESYSESSSRSFLEGRSMSGMDGEFITNPSQYRRETESGYFESRRENTPAPPVRNYRDYYNKEIMNTRAILGRDNTDPHQ